MFYIKIIIINKSKQGRKQETLFIVILMHHMFSTMSDVSKVIQSNNTEVLSGKQLYFEWSIEHFILGMCCLILFLSVELWG